jgi:hypothetical protein
VGAESGQVHYIDELLIAAEDEPRAAGPGAAAGSGAARRQRRAEAAALTPAEASAVAAAAAEAELARALSARPPHIQPTADLPIPEIPTDGSGLRYIPGDEAKWRPDTERALLVAKQPGLVRALTPEGFQRRPIPPKLFGRLRLFYDTERARGSKGVKPEWEKGGPRLIVDPEDSGRVSTAVVTLSMYLRDEIVQTLRQELGEWADVPPSSLIKSAVYGIREYSRGVVLKRHVDRVQSHVLSAILNIAQRGMDSHWCLTINDHDGVEHQVNLLPGEMLLYESAALVHGRPYPLDGEAYANAFVHFRPESGWDYTPGQ